MHRNRCHARMKKRVFFAQNYRFTEQVFIVNLCPCLAASHVPRDETAGASKPTTRSSEAKPEAVGFLTALRTPGSAHLTSTNFGGPPTCCGQVDCIKLHHRVLKKEALGCTALFGHALLRINNHLTFLTDARSDASNQLHFVASQIECLGSTQT